MTRLSRLEKLYFRLEAQHACLAWAFAELESRPGVVFELGLGHGRSFDHLRMHLPGRDIYVFDREAGSYPDCTPDPQHLILGDLDATLPAAAKRFAGQVVLAHSDVGSFEASHNRMMSELVSVTCRRALAQDAIILSDLPLFDPGCRGAAASAGARAERYYLYRFSANQ